MLVLDAGTERSPARPGLPACRTLRAAARRSATCPGVGRGLWRRADFQGRFRGTFLFTAPPSPIAHKDGHGALSWSSSWWLLCVAAEGRGPSLPFAVGLREVSAGAVCVSAPGRWGWERSWLLQVHGGRALGTESCSGLLPSREAFRGKRRKICAAKSERLRPPLDLAEALRVPSFSRELKFSGVPRSILQRLCVFL